MTSEKVSNPPNHVSRPRTCQPVSGGDSNEDGAEDTAESIEDDVPEYWLRIPTTGKSHEEASGTLTPTLSLPVGCDPQLPSAAPGGEKLPVLMDPAGQEACLDNSHKEKLLEEVMNQQTESNKMSESGELSEGQLSEKLPECPVEEEQGSDEVEPEEETRTPVQMFLVILHPMLKILNLSRARMFNKTFSKAKRKNERLQYRELGNPLFSVAQALFHRLTTAFTNSKWS